MSAKTQIRRVLGLTTLLITVEYFLLPVAFFSFSLLFSISSGGGYDDRILTGAVFFPFVVTAYRIVWLNYFLVMAVLLVLERDKIPRISLLWRLMIANAASYALLRIVLASVTDSSANSLLADLLAQSPYRDNYFRAVGVAAFVAPLLVAKLVGESVDRALFRIRRAFSLISLLILTEYVLMTALLLLLERAFTVFGGDPDKGLLAEGRWIVESLGLAATIVFFRLSLSNYQLTVAMLMAFGRRPESPFSGFVKTLAACIAGGVLPLALWAVAEYETLERFLFFEAQNSWGGNFLYLSATTAVAAPCAVYAVSRRIGRLRGLF